ncbi:MAG: MmgE/PrpD family protein [Pseudomonadota bacterium]
MSAISRLGPFISRGCPTDDPALRQRVVQAFVDTIGCMSVGAGAEAVQRLCRAFEPVAPGVAPVFSTSVKLSPPMAALVNGASAHAWDLDDWEDMGNTHPSAALVPAILAAASVRRCSGERALSAYATGFEVIARLGAMATSGQYQAGFHVTGTLGALGAAAAVAHLMQLNSEQSGNAVALAASQAMGLTAQFGSDAKALHAGLAAKAGLLSAQMAGSGIRGRETVLDSPRGFFAALCPGWAGDASQLDHLGNPPALIEGGIYVKRHPSCAYTHRLMSCAETISKASGFEPEVITAVTAILPDFHRAILPFSEPETRTEALFSLEFCISQTLLRRRVSLAALDRADWQEPDCRALMNRITVQTETAVNPDRPIDPRQPDRLFVTCGERNYDAQCAWPEGAPARPLGSGGIAAKFPDLPVDALIGWSESSDVAEYIGRIC